ncbi:hypothetical protein [Nocardiopsis suaedae]|uniref:Uncharacterized protein n=1 Tax=Nocardiopsis suaedae TaxID=3018444 RepID=A0ABT4TMB8_9ACTN|nr:hypothetical protein [Nocardiopsis suaedae]MDA2805399.1 hypothetical protein [Nocardiopsis suaedae]
MSAEPTTATERNREPGPEPGHGPDTSPDQAAPQAPAGGPASPGTDGGDTSLRCAEDAASDGPAPAPGPDAPAPEHRVVLDLDPMTHAELRRAAHGRTVGSYLYVIAGRYARWSEMRDWLGRLEACYGPLPAEALERVHRRMLGLSQVRGAGNTLSVAFSDEEFAALEEAADGRPLAPFVRETVIDRLTRADAPGPRS